MNNVRDEKGRFASPVEMTDEQRDAIVYKSKLLNKYYDSWDELQAAENEYNKAHEAELKAKAERKAESEKVREAITARVKAQLAAKKAKTEAYRAYCKACDDAEKLVEEKREVEEKELKAFCKKHPDGFHETIKIDDVAYRFDYSTTATDTSYLDPFIKLLSWF